MRSWKRMKRKRWLRDWDDESDPMTGAANLVDAILVFACGLIITIVIYWNLHGLVFGEMTAEERKEALQIISRATAVRQGEELKELPQLAQGEGEGYREMGTVYMDPETGKLIMVVREGDVRSGEGTVSP